MWCYRAEQFPHIIYMCIDLLTVTLMLGLITAAIPWSQSLQLEKSLSLVSFGCNIWFFLSSSNMPELYSESESNNTSKIYKKVYS